MRRAAGLLALLVLSGCQPPRVDGAACDAGGRTGFALGDTPGLLFGPSPPRPRSVIVFREGRGEQVWNSRAPEHGMLARLIGGGEPERRVLTYGAALPGWETSEPPAALEPGQSYWAEVWIEGGMMARMEWREGMALPACARIAARLQARS